MEIHLLLLFINLSSIISWLKVSSSSDWKLFFEPIIVDSEVGNTINTTLLVPVQSSCIKSKTFSNFSSALDLLLKSFQVIVKYFIFLWLNWFKL